ncbi:ABC transporter ATP-binding protein [Celeribacter neptunius]|uniref:Branched-chain amino acid transport system ATP-binding protein n=1 Tax=Celeribacter neptunius TaxID=588602 RepID=A0A1I3UGB4_9RHOB|nr:ABC transporter ATP-binding protein [Celeribacter neptunius]SFJ80817.1 branched-chain amino acid transport system ATP-binding protein [Celeribacter neptunius]
MLEVDRINVSYGDFHVLHEVSLRVGKGEMVAVLGANGHGKSTLLKALCGLLPIQTGVARFEGDDITKLASKDLVRRGLVYVAEDRRLFRDMSVLDNLMLGAFNTRAWSERADTLRQVFALYPRLEERQHQLCRRLSGGEAQMVALGRGLMSKPHLLVIDEPSLGLAPNLTAQMMETINQLNREGMTILLVEQNAALLTGHIDRTYVIEEGVVTQGDLSALGEIQ